MSNVNRVIGKYDNEGPDEFPDRRTVLWLFNTGGRLRHVHAGIRRTIAREI